MKLIKANYSLGALEKSKGIEKGPSIILEELKSIWLSENFRTSKLDIIEFSKNDSIENDLDGLYQLAKSINENGIILALGGDHSITYPLFKSLSEKYQNSGIVIFDAHPDCFQNFDYPTHEDWLKFLIDRKILKPENVILVGLRNVHPDELDYLKEHHIKYYPSKSLDNPQDVCDYITEIAMKFDSLYLSIDIDVLDPAFAPGTGYSEPGGMTSRELLYFVSRLKLLKNLKFVDIVEVNPEKDLNNITSRTAAKLLKEFM